MSLAPAVHIAVLEAANIHDSLADAIARERWQDGMPTNALLISGPSKTADIELVLTFGVHGPKELIVLILDGLAPLPEFQALSSHLAPGKEGWTVTQKVAAASSSAPTIKTRLNKMLPTAHAHLHRDLQQFIPATRLINDPLRTLAYGTDASLYRLIPNWWCGWKAKTRCDAFWRWRTSTAHR